MWFGLHSNQKLSSSPLVSIDQLAAELKLPSHTAGGDLTASSNPDAIQDLIYPLVKDRDHDLKQNSQLKHVLHQLAETINREYEGLQTARGVSDRAERLSIVRNIASRIDLAFERAATEGLTTMRSPLASTVTDDPSRLQQQIREQYSDLQQLDRNLEQTINARLKAYAVQVVATTKAPQLKDAVKKAMDNIANISRKNAEGFCPEWHLADDTLAALPYSQSAQIQMLEQILPILSEAITIQKEAAKLGANYNADMLREYVQEKLKCADLSGALTAAKALQLCKNSNPEDLTILAAIYRRMGSQMLEFYTLRAMCLGQGVGTASDYSRLAYLTAEIGVHGTATRGFIQFLASKIPPDSLYIDLVCEIAILAGDAGLLNEYRHLFQHGSQLSKARLALNDKNWLLAGETAVGTYLGSYEHQKAPILEQRALAIAAEATFMQEGAVKITHTTHPSMGHINDLLTYQSSDLEALPLIEKLASNSFFAQLIKELATSKPTYDTLILAGQQALAAKDTKTARARFDDAKGRDPSRPEAYCGFASMVEDTDPNTALSLFRHALALSPASTEAREGIARYAQRQTAHARVRNNANLVISPLEEVPADILEQVTEHCSKGQPSDKVIQTTQIEDYLRRTNSIFREMRDKIQPGAKIHALGVDLSNRILKLSKGLNAAQQGGAQAWQLLVAEIRMDFGSIPADTSSAVRFGCGLREAAKLAEALDPHCEVLKSPEAHTRLQSILSSLTAIAKGADAFTFGSPEWQTALATFARTFSEAHAPITALTDDVGSESQRLSEWTARLAETVAARVRSGAMPVGKTSRGQAATNTVISSPQRRQTAQQ